MWFWEADFAKGERTVATYRTDNKKIIQQNSKIKVLCIMTLMRAGLHRPKQSVQNLQRCSLGRSTFLRVMGLLQPKYMDQNLLKPCFQFIFLALLSTRTHTRTHAHTEYLDIGPVVQLRPNDGNTVGWALTHGKMACWC